jgi:hypothetical protein
VELLGFCKKHTAIAFHTHTHLKNVVEVGAACRQNHFVGYNFPTLAAEGDVNKVSAGLHPLESRGHGMPVSIMLKVKVVLGRRHVFQQQKCCSG